MNNEMVEAWSQANCISFDGRVVEVFGSSSSADRYHIREAYVRIDKPNRRGFRSLLIGRLRSRDGTELEVAREDWADMASVIRRLEVAGAHIEWA